MSRFSVPALVGVLFWATGRAEGQELFRLVVDPDSANPFSDATGRHQITIGGVADIDPDVPVVPGHVEATSIMAPDGSKAALFSGGWLEMITSDVAFAGDFALPPNKSRTLSFWFKSGGNGAYDAIPGNPDRMHAAGLGTVSNNLDVDLGDNDSVGTLPATACWTYWDGPGDKNVVETASHDRNHYLDDQWHHYVLARDSGLVTVYLDDILLGTTSYSAALGSGSTGAHSYIGRGSPLSEVGGDPFPWFGYIAGFTIMEDPDTTPPSLLCPPFVLAVDSKSGPFGDFVSFTVTAFDDHDPTPSVVCTPPSGSYFARGATIVTCTATDASGNQAVCTFPVVVVPTTVGRRL